MMKIIIRPLPVLIIVLFFSWSAHAASVPFSIFHTNDLHSHLDPIAVPMGEHYERRGGFARLSTLIGSIRKEKRDEIVIGLDAGDFFAGTIFSGLALTPTKDFPELLFFQENKYDIVTLGNHEFDPRNAGLEIMLAKFSRHYSSVPLVSSNLFIKNNSALGKFVGADKLIRPWIVKEFKSKKGNLKVGFLGILGPDGCLVSRSTRGDVGFVGFDDDDSDEELNKLVDFLNPLIKQLKEKEKVDVVVLSMHGGGDESLKLAKALQGLDILIAGHTHKVEFAQVGDVVVNQTGAYGENLGFMEFAYDAQKRKVRLLYPQKSPVIKVTDQIPPHPLWKKRIEQWRKKSFQLMGHKKERPEEVVFTPQKSHIRSHAIPNPMGQLVTNGILAELNENKTVDAVDLYITSMGLVRTSFYKNVPYTRAEIFEAVSIGFDENLRPGVDIVSFYLSPSDVKQILNFMEFYSHISTSFSPAISSSLSFKIRKWGIPFINRIHDIKLNGVDLGKIDRPLKVATNGFILNNIETVKKITRGWIEIIPRDRLGQPLKKLSTHSKEYRQLTEHLKKHGHKY